MNLMDLATPNGLFCDGDWIEKKDQDPQGSVRLIQLADIGVCQFKNKSSRYVTKETCLSLHCTTLQQGDILIARLPDPLGRACLFPLDGSYITAVDVAILRIKRPDIDSKYIMYLINSPQFRNAIKQYESGTTRKRISRKNLERIEFNVPPLDEQQRIVARIEELFSQLDSAVVTLNTIKQQLEVYRQAVYSSVFSTELPMHLITEFFDISGGLTKNSKRDELPIKMPYLRVANVYFNYLDLSEIKHIGVTETEIERCLLAKDDLMFVEGNGSKSQIGRVAMWDGSIVDCLHQNHLIKGRPNGKMLSKYALYYLISSGGRKQIIEVARSTSGLYTLSTNKVRDLRIPYCDLSYQQDMVDRIELRLDKCTRIEQTVQMALQQAEALRQSILKQAFERST